MSNQERDKAWEDLCRFHCVDFDDQGDQCADNIGLDGIFNAGWDARNAEVERLEKKLEIAIEALKEANQYSLHSSMLEGVLLMALKKIGEVDE